MQVDPIKPTLKPPGTQRLKLKYDEVLSNFAFKFNLRRYNEERAEACTREADEKRQLKVRWRRLTLSSPR